MSVCGWLVVDARSHRRPDHCLELRVGAQELGDVLVRDDRAHLRARRELPGTSAGHHAGESRPVLGAVKGASLRSARRIVAAFGP